MGRASTKAVAMACWRGLNVATRMVVQSASAPAVTSAGIVVDVSGWRTGQSKGAWTVATTGPREAQPKGFYEKRKRRDR